MVDTISIMITDDHALVRQGIRTFLELQPDLVVVGEADTGEAAVRMAAELVPDVALMDLVMPGIGGVEAGETGQPAYTNYRAYLLSRR